MKIAIGCDHIVTEIKNQLKNYVESQGHEIIDCGTFDKVRTHYPIYGKKVGEAVVSKKVDLGIVLCGTGIGITNSVNKVKGARCALVGDAIAAKNAKETLNCNVIGVGGRVSGIGAIQEIIDVFLKTPYLSTEQNNEMITKIDELIDTISGFLDDHYFDEFLEKWDRGEYHD